MISSICFENKLIIPKDEAEALGLRYESDAKIGVRNGKKSIMGSYDHYKDECIEKEGKYYKDQTALGKSDPLEGYSLYDRCNENDLVCVAEDNHLVDLLTFAPKCKHKFFIKESIRTKEPTINNIQAILLAIEDKATALDRLADKIGANCFNKKVNVHVGGGLIVTYNDLLLVEDACTDALQAELNNGWRIIAVCAQPDQRRPDYILGRYNPKLEVSEKPKAGR